MSTEVEQVEQNIRVQLELARQQKVLTKRNKLTILEVIQVAKEGSDTFETKLAIGKDKRGTCYVFSYTKDLPSDPSQGKMLTLFAVDIILGVIKDYKECKGYHCNPYTWLVAGCYTQGLDLIKEGYLEL